MVGNVMIDSLEQSRSVWERSDLVARLGLSRGGYGVVTLHRPSNVDDPATLRGLVKALSEVGRRIPLVFPVHPRTRGSSGGDEAESVIGSGARYIRRSGISISSRSSPGRVSF